MQRTFIAAAVLLAALSTANAATIGGLANTGVGVGGAKDANYTLTAVSDPWIGTTTPVITLDNTWPVNPWMANSATSKWITPTASQGQSFDAWNAGTYTYSLSFDLTGYNASTASFSGRVAADNTVKVVLNNVEIGTGNGFTDWSSFTTSTTGSSAFVSGTNQLDFVVTNWAQNGGNPTGLRVEFDASSVAAVPEPETYGMLLAGLALV
ncbi:MAG: PEP-CTERM sorting domain-containing protein, partial [Duganella sp.]